MNPKHDPFEQIMYAPRENIKQLRRLAMHGATVLMLEKSKTLLEDHAPGRTPTSHGWSDEARIDHRP